MTIADYAACVAQAFPAIAAVVVAAASVGTVAYVVRAFPAIAAVVVAAAFVGTNAGTNIIASVRQITIADCAACVVQACPAIAAITVAAPKSSQVYGESQSQIMLHVLFKHAQPSPQSSSLQHSLGQLQTLFKHSQPSPQSPSLQHS
jgi:hypothetical protein